MDDNISPFDRFRNLVNRYVAPVPPEPAPDVPTPEEEAAANIRRWAKEGSSYLDSLIVLIDSNMGQAEMNENASLANQPLMCFHHGRVAAFKELKALLLNISRSQAPSGQR